MESNDASEGGIQLMVVGCGSIGSSLLSGWLEANYDPAEIAVVEPSRTALERVGRSDELQVYESDRQIPAGANPRVIVFAVGDQILDRVVSAYRRFADTGALMVCITGGRTTDYYEVRLGQRAAIVRATPSIAAEIGLATTVAISNANVSRADRDLCDELFAAVGDVVWLTEERDMHVAGALSGVGAACVFVLAEALSDAGIERGLAPELAMRIATSALSGAGALTCRRQHSPRDLQRRVAGHGSPNQGALEILLEEPGLTALITEAVKAASRRSREMSLEPR